MKALKNWVLFAVVALASTAMYAQGVTTSAIRGQILEEQGPLPGANVVAVHKPTGTKYGSITDFDGFYRIANMRVGGPYTITVSYVGKESAVFENIYLQLGETERINVTLADSASELDEVIVTATRNGIFIFFYLGVI